MPRPLPPNAEALRAQATQPSEPEANPVEVAFDLADEISASLQVIALALSGLFTIEAARSRDMLENDDEATQLRAKLTAIASQLAQAMQGDDAPDNAAGGTEA